jgi:hypothetical protein
MSTLFFNKIVNYCRAFWFYKLIADSLTGGCNYCSTARHDRHASWRCGYLQRFTISASRNVSLKTLIVRNFSNDALPFSRGISWNSNCFIIFPCLLSGRGFVHCMVIAQFPASESLIYQCKLWSVRLILFYAAELARANFTWLFHVWWTRKAARSIQDFQMFSSRSKCQISHKKH